MEVPQKPKNRPTIWSSNATLDIYQKKQNTNSKSYLYLNVLRSTIYNGQDMKATQMPINRWIDKEGMGYNNGILSTHKKNEILHLQWHGQA